MKVCTKCGELKPVASFPTNNARPDKRHYYCKECCRVYYESTREKSIDRSREWQLANGEKQRQLQQLWRASNREKIRQYQSEYYQANKRKLNSAQPHNLRRSISHPKAFAARAREPWEAWEDQHLLFSNLTLRQIALDLQRTYDAIRHRRRELVRKALEEV